MTPLQIQMMLHYYADTEPYALHEPCHAVSVAVCDQRACLLRDNLIQADVHSGSGYRVTERGEAYIEALQNLPLPLQVWIMPPPEPGNYKISN